MELHGWLLLGASLFSPPRVLELPWKLFNISHAWTDATRVCAHIVKIEQSVCSKLPHHCGGNTLTIQQHTVVTDNKQPLKVHRKQ